MRYSFFVFLFLFGISCSKENPDLVRFQVVSPYSADTLSVGDTLVIEAGNVSSNTTRMDFFVDNVFAAEIKEPPYIYKRKVTKNDIGRHVAGFLGTDEKHNSSFGVGEFYQVVEKK